MAGLDVQDDVGGTEVWRGGVNAWECDEMGHMNTRFYVTRCMEGLAVLFAMAGLPGIFAAGARTTMQVDEMHIRFHREAPAATPLYLTAGFVRVGSADAEVVALLRHSVGGAMAATFHLTLRAAAPDSAEVPWPASLQSRATALAISVPTQALPRSVDTGPVRPIDLPGALQAHRRIALGSLAAADCDAFGRMLPQKFMAAVADGIRQLTMPLREIVAAHAQTPPVNVGGALLEFRMVHLGRPRLGDCFEVRSALTRADAKTMALEHWMVDPVDGRAWAHMQSIAVVFDIDRRAIVGISDAALEALRPMMLA
jgi:acyl-CoA thioester hydrolase